MAAISMACVSSQCLSLSSKLQNLTLSSPSTQLPNSALKPLSFSANFSQSVLSQGCSSFSTFQRRTFSVVCEAAPQKTADSAAKRARQAETRRLRNKARKSEVKTRMRKVFEALDVLKKKTGPAPEELVPIDNLLAEAYSAIDKAVVKGSLHRNTAARRKSRLARNKKVVEIHHGWYTPVPAPTTV
ncbi:30S ribosomal protein S20, chloroplastic [Beta vulgaris subsp. vulgaris]|uniref:30S ribosomal protein S20, chloroplastic n=1 Tax=Beta vulgaris subsp. vulgaris TaxID=3555 RepID=UPI002036C58A|nr:30S ribosomal protein S20, chloroplastic [Beta vulgaris subsp. vulgaris]